MLSLAEATSLVVTYLYQNDSLPFLLLQALAENIDDFESPSTEDDDVSPHPSPFLLPHTSTPAPNAHKPQINRGLPIPTPTLECAPTPEYMSISTPPSSPEIPSVSDLNRAKTSDWIKQVQLEPTERSRSEVTLNDTMRTPHAPDSARKGRGRKFVPGGLAERLQRLIQHENSEVTFWEHRVKKLDDKELGRWVYSLIPRLSLGMRLGWWVPFPDHCGMVRPPNFH